MIYRFDQMVDPSERVTLQVESATRKADIAYEVEQGLESKADSDEAYRLLGYADAGFELWHGAAQAWKQVALTLADELNQTKGTK